MSYRIIKCHVCKKSFIYNPMSIYKIPKNGKLKYMCSYTCWRKVGGDSDKTSKYKEYEY